MAKGPFIPYHEGGYCHPIVGCGSEGLATQDKKGCVCVFFLIVGVAFTVFTAHPSMNMAGCGGRSSIF